jgi:hypoxanthine phosphoribosyltransferase
MKKRFIGWDELGRLVEELSRRVKGVKVDLVVGIARGGLPISMVVADRLRVPIDFINVKSYRGMGVRGRPMIISTLYEDVKGKDVLIVDDLVDEGETMNTVIKYIKDNYSPRKIYTAVLFIKPWSSFKPDFYLDVLDEWVVFPWELKEFGEE